MSSSFLKEFDDGGFPPINMTEKLNRCSFDLF